MFLRGLRSRVLELGGESATDRHPTVYPGSYVEYVQKLGHEAPRDLFVGPEKWVRPVCPSIADGPEQRNIGRDP